MSVFARCGTPITVTIGRQFTLPVTYTDPTTGTAISTAGMAIDAALEWTGLAVPLPVAFLERDDTAATGVLQIDDGTAALLPNDRVLSLRLSYTDSSGETDDVLYTLWGVTP